MTFEQWIFGKDFNNPRINGEWGLLHILILVFCIILIVGITLIFRKKDEKFKRNILFIISGILLFFEIARRIVNIANPITFTKYNLLWVMLPRPGCAISVWLVLLSPFINRKWFYNFTSIISILCAVIFFAYPGAGFIHQYTLFEDLYSIVSHSLFFVGSFLIVTLKMAKFDYRNVKFELISLGGLIIYCLLEMFVLKKNSSNAPLELDPFYALPNNEVQEIVGINNYIIYIILYVLFMCTYFSSFYLISKKNINKIK